MTTQKYQIITAIVFTFAATALVFFNIGVESSQSENLTQIQNAMRVIAYMFIISPLAINQYIFKRIKGKYEFYDTFLIATITISYATILLGSVIWHSR